MIKRINGSLVRVTTFNPNTPWRKHGNYVHEQCERSTRHWDRMSQREVAPMGKPGDHGLVIRRNGVEI